VRMHGKAIGEHGGKHGKGAVSRQELTSLPEWKRSRELLARCTAAPTLNLEAGSS
jgi:hypothetical protein